MFNLIVKFSFPGEIIYHQQFFFESEEEMKEFSERVNKCPFTEIVDKVIIDGEELSF